MTNMNISSKSDSELQDYFNNANLDELHKLKLYADDMYYNKGEESGLGDYQYDMLKETLEYRDPDYIVPIGAKIREGENRKELPFWLGSMDKFKPEDKEDIERWNNKNISSQYILEDKLDGVSCLVVIKKGKIKLYTRGDGIVGADISYLSQYFDTLPRNLNNLDINIRGELIMPVNIFNKKYKDKYANPRNMVAGQIGAKKIREGLKDIKFIAYEIVGNSLMDKPTDQLNYLDSLGFTTVRYKIIDKITIDNLIQTLLLFKSKNNFEIDGIIVQPNDKYIRNLKGNPSYAFAFKMRLSNNIIEAKVVDVLWNVSKWGKIKPRIKIKPIHLGGVKITYTTGFNGKYIYNNKIGNGAIINITRSGDVIPYILEVVKQAEEPSMPDIPWSWNKSGVDVIVQEYGQTMCIKLIHGFFDKLNIKFLGEKTIEKLYEGGLDTLLKIIGASKEDIEKIDGLADVGSSRIYKNIKNGMKNLKIPIVLGASGIFGFGMGSKRITKLFDDIPNILEDSKKMTKEEIYNKIMKVEGFSNITTQNIVNNIEWAIKFINALSIFATFEKKENIKKDLVNITVVITGSRKHIQKEMEDFKNRGGKITGSVANKTTYVVSGDKPGDNKIKDANRLDIPIISIPEFLKLYF